METSENRNFNWCANYVRIKRFRQTYERFWSIWWPKKISTKTWYSFLEENGSSRVLLFYAQTQSGEFVLRSQSNFRNKMVELSEDANERHLKHSSKTYNIDDRFLATRATTYPWLSRKKFNGYFTNVQRCDNCERHRCHHRKDSGISI